MSLITSLPSYEKSSYFIQSTCGHFLLKKKKGSDYENILSFPWESPNEHLHFFLQLKNYYRYLQIPYSFGKHLLYSKKWCIIRYPPLLLSMWKNSMKKISYYYVMFNLSIFLTYQHSAGKSFALHSWKFQNTMFDPIIYLFWDFGLNQWRP